MPTLTKGLAVFAFLAIPLCLIIALSEADRRTTLSLEAAERTSFRLAMRSHVIDLDEILTAMAKGDYDTAATIASDRMDSAGQRAHHLSDIILPGPDTPAFRETERALHNAADRFGEAARASPGSPEMRARYQELVAVCQGCHTSFRIDPGF
ncbi:cytochrome c [Rhodospirillum rubrum]|uniref:Cytochrome c n=1 Tax=Rhodospirillum rubrum (strain ATCC 11170 / ATH 1.1.1 / DSM 467 / LMG 4362 / NCIMB 8255 / S1) TaxID=269796 RepID=Q2RNJ9_RHORT|nr:cytochrome c [Rhodospirillum rubrum]ABC24296.1 hypothetical protein Rru_A3502 [Rhodospirillum rubrum ATCC 11170]AEO50047.1 hypothetical protein F11_17935 [Rhodospirillum rubrum F11]MBK5956015.1 hypothetical protein [Rhodospirillum rubrum]QXG80223.1 cytochrome c [Rhodospirillum rubrum]HAP99578.1 hypothetical protein [Rhodospirillum rubrum]